MGWGREVEPINIELSSKQSNRKGESSREKAELKIWLFKSLTKGRRAKTCSG